MTADVNGLPLLASMDGLTMLGDVGWETKLLNQDLRAAVEAGTLDEHYTVQMEQQLMVSGASRIYFTTTDGTPENTFGVGTSRTRRCASASSPAGSSSPRTLQPTCPSPRP